MGQEVEIDNKNSDPVDPAVNPIVNKLEVKSKIDEGGGLPAYQVISNKTSHNTDIAVQEEEGGWQGEPNENRFG